MDAEGRLHALQTFVGKVFETVWRVRLETVAMKVGLTVFNEYLLAVRFVPVPRSTCDENRAIGTSATQGLRKRSLVIFGVMERRVVNDEIELIVHERKGIELSLETRKERSEVLFVVAGGAQPIAIICEQVHGDWRMTFKRQSVAQPTIAGPEIQDSELPVVFWDDARKNMLLDISESAGSQY
jgi:hypothetical protein